MDINVKDGLCFIRMNNAKLHRIAREGQSACPNKPELHTIRISFDDGNNSIQLDFSEAEAKSFKEKLNKRKDL